jgi:hypothetical protein
MADLDLVLQRRCTGHRRARYATSHAPGWDEHLMLQNKDRLLQQNVQQFSSNTTERAE